MHINDSGLICENIGSGKEEPLEKEMATHSSVLAWRIPGMGDPVGLPSMGLHRVGHNWSDLAAAAAEVKIWSKQASPSFIWVDEECQGWTGTF